MSRIDGDRKNICGENIKRYRQKKGLSLEQCCVELEQEGLVLSAKELEQIEQGQKVVLDQEIICFCKEKLERIDVLVNNACVSHQGILNQCNYQEFQKSLSIGVTAPYYLSLQCQDELKKNKGSIINIASSRAFQSEPNTESYTSAKGGIVALTHALAISLSGQVRVNCIAPGWIDVNDTESFSKEDETAIPVGRVGKPIDIARMVMFLCSEDAGFITGETFVVDGGMSKRMIYHGDHGWEYHI